MLAGTSDVFFLRHAHARCEANPRSSFIVLGVQNVKLTAHLLERRDKEWVELYLYVPYKHSRHAHGKECILCACVCVCVCVCVCERAR